MIRKFWTVAISEERLRRGSALEAEGGPDQRTVESFQEATLRLGDSLLVRLASLGTSGYRWQVIESGDQVRVIRESQSGEGRGLPVGSSPDELFRIVATVPGETRVVFDQARPWEGDRILNRHVVSVQVQP